MYLESQRRAFAVLAAAFVSIALAGAAQAEEKLKPFVLASVSDTPVAQQVEATRSALTGAGFSVLGEYAPFDDAHVIVVTSPELQQAAAASERGGYLAAQRVSVTRVGDKTQVAYANPIYIRQG